MNQYPEHEKLKALSDKQRHIQEFLDWLEDGEEHPQVVRGNDGEIAAKIPKQWRLAFYPTRTHNNNGVMWPEEDWKGSHGLESVTTTYATIIAMFLGIDEKAFEAEKVQMLEECRKLLEKKEASDAERTDETIRSDG